MQSEVEQVEAILREHIASARGSRAPGPYHLVNIPEAAAAIAALRAQDREDEARAALRWERRDGGWWAHSADLLVGFTVKRRADGGGFEWAYEVTAVFTKWITKGHGETKSERTAKAAVERAWITWLEHAGLVALPLASARTEDGDA